MSAKKLKEAERTATEGLETASVERRSFLKGLGLAATGTVMAGTATALTGSPQSATAAESESPKAKRTRGLAGAPVVMAWRRVEDPSRSRKFVKDTLHLPEVQADRDTAVFDGGNVLVGFASVHSSRTVGPPQPEILTEPYFAQANPANTLMHVPADFTAGEDLHFLDADGNDFGYLSPSREGPARAKARTSRAADAPVGAVELLVSDLDRSTKYYSEVLGLKVLSRGQEETTLDLGTISLTLRPERTGMMVAFLNRTGRLLGGWQVFHVADIDRTVADLRANGADFPAGIETSPVGRVAYLNDPDGHPWVLWQPSGKAGALKYHQNLSRILAAVRV